MAQQQQQNNKQQGGNQGRGNKPFKLKPMTIIYIVLLVFIGYLVFGGSGSSSIKQPITWERLEPILEKHDYESITVINEEVAEIRIKPEAVRRDTATYRELISRTLTGAQGPQGMYV